MVEQKRLIAAALRLRWLIVPFVSLLCLRATWGWQEEIHPDRVIAREAGKALWLNLDLGVYGSHRSAQMGPLALLVEMQSRAVADAIVVLLLMVPVAIGVHRARTPWQWAVVLCGGLLAVEPWTQLAWKGHADDALVITGTFIAVEAMTRGRLHLSSVGCAIAFAGKPTAVALLAVAAPETGLMVAYAAIMILIYLPFLAADPGGFLGAGRGIMPVGHDSLPMFLGHGKGTPIPVWVRPVQLILAPVSGAYWALRNRPWEALVWIFALRAFVETNPAPAYSIPLVLLSVPADLRHRFPLLLATSAASFWFAQDVPIGEPGAPRLLALIAVMVVCTIRIAHVPRADRGGAQGAEDEVSGRAASRLTRDDSRGK